MSVFPLFYTLSSLSLEYGERLTPYHASSDSCTLLPVSAAVVISGHGRMQDQIKSLVGVQMVRGQEGCHE